MELREATQYLLYRADNPAQWLALADEHMDTFRKMPDSFILPAQHAVLEPLINVYHDDLAGFAEYVRAIRTRLPKGPGKAAVQEFYRKLAIRHVQQVRRERVDHALRAYERALATTITTADKTYLAVQLEKYWTVRREAMLKAHSLGRRMSVAEREILLADFWKQIDAEIEAGDLPMFKLTGDNNA